MANKQKPHILVVLTCQRLIFARSAFCLIETALSKRDYTFDFHVEMGCDIVSQRNRAVIAAKERKATHLLFVDYDMYFAPDTISKLLAADKDIIGAAYNFRGETLKSTAVPEGSEEQLPPDQLPTEPFKCETLGTGLLLIKMDVFNKLAAPYFMFGYKADGTMLYGEDTYFCQMAKKNGGFEVWADPTLGAKHIGEQLF